MDRLNVTKGRPKGDRYFVVNSHDGKNGRRHRATEFESHEAASKAAFVAVCWIEEFTGWLPGVQPESFEVFVGSKTQLDRRYNLA